MRTETGLYIVQLESRVQVYTEQEWLKEKHRIWWANLKDRYFKKWN